MATQRDQQGASEFLDALHSLSIETEEEIILGATPEQIEVRLAEEGINLDSHKAALRTRMKQYSAKRKLAEARDHRLAQEKSLADRAKKSVPSTEEMRAEIGRRLGLLPSAKGTAGVSTQAYFNRFKAATDEDLPGLLDDLEFLEKQNTEEPEGSD